MIDLTNREQVAGMYYQYGELLQALCDIEEAEKLLQLEQDTIVKLREIDEIELPISYVSKGISKYLEHLQQTAKELSNKIANA